MGQCEALLNALSIKSVDLGINLLATVVGILIVLWLERKRRPRLEIKLGSTIDAFQNDLAGRTPRRWPHLEVHNLKIAPWLSWVYDGDPALSCKAWISFHSLIDGRRIFAADMPARWSEADQPSIAEMPGPGGSRLAGIQNVQYAIDIPTGECMTISPATRPNNDVSCYGWNNESYLHTFDHPNWKLDKGRYYVRLKVITVGREFVDSFLLVNDGPYADFRLENLDAATKHLVKG